ncbi:unnamed protein product [Cuscuta epithymum]|uniref:Uncharacterized protein n=1 Tax=Cuscuta epithymum TaxID=186058 RepID=A0AAV0GE25_9ASTE|nr:unnamed protein product [Cuscuta epithymum]CAH9146073.1 unnamed protein product [Cuscuta epithymum]
MDHTLRKLPEADINRLSNMHALGPALDSDPMLDYIFQILLEEDSIDGNNHNMFLDPLALSATEKSFIEALHGNSSSPFHSNDVRPIEPKSSETSDWSYGVDLPDLTVLPSLSMTNLGGLNGALCSRDSHDIVPNIFCDDNTESILKVQRGEEEAEKHQSPPETRDVVSNIEKDRSADPCRGKKHFHPDDIGVEEERRMKHSAVYKEEVELSEVFDKVLLCVGDDDTPSRVGRTQQKGRNGRKSHSKKRSDSCEIVDLEALLTSCAESVAACDYSTAEDELKKIRHHSSPTGNAKQRLVNFFADGLAARMAGTGTQLCATLSESPYDSMVSEMLKSHLSPLPFVRLSIFFANKMIYEVALEAESLHIIDFGILYGIQWPTLIRDLSERPGGPPKLRITGIELPQPGFRPSQMVEQTGCRLAKYCERFNVPFEYNSITAKNWETLKIDDFKLVNGGEVVAVNCVVRLEHLLDETVVVGDGPCPRDSILNLIREVNPDIYVQSVRNGANNSPFFLSRFREALFFYSAVFDMYDAVIPSHSHEMMIFEKEFLGREIMNIIACEGIERSPKTETYKQWHSRNIRAGLKPVPINPEVLKKYKSKARTGYHKDFLFTEDGHWILQGWKGRIFGGSSCWVSARKTCNL